MIQHGIQESFLFSSILEELALISLSLLFDSFLALLSCDPGQDTIWDRRLMGGPMYE